MCLWMCIPLVASFPFSVGPDLVSAKDNFAFALRGDLAADTLAGIPSLPKTHMLLIKHTTDRTSIQLRPCRYINVLHCKDTYSPICPPWKRRNMPLKYESARKIPAILLDSRLFRRQSDGNTRQRTSSLFRNLSESIGVPSCLHDGRFKITQQIPESEFCALYSTD